MNLPSASKTYFEVHLLNFFSGQVLNTDLKEIMMDHGLRTISYIADIGELVVIMARRRVLPQVRNHNFFFRLMDEQEPEGTNDILYRPCTIYYVKISTIVNIY